MTDEQKAPAPAETEHAVEVARGLSVGPKTLHALACKIGVPAANLWPVLDRMRADGAVACERVEYGNGRPGIQWRLVASHLSAEKGEG